MFGEIRRMTAADREEVLDMMRVFYASPAVLTGGSEEIFERDFSCCVSDSPYLEGYVFEGAGKILGYAMLAKSFSTEFGKQCIWIEDLYLKEPYRGMGIGGAFLNTVSKLYPDALQRLEAEEENERAVSVYRARGFRELPYLEMVKHPEDAATEKW